MSNLRLLCIFLTISISCNQEKITDKSNRNPEKSDLVLPDTSAELFEENGSKPLGNNTISSETWTESLDIESPNYLHLLDSAAQKSDASLSEEIGLASSSYYEKKPIDFIRYLASKQSPKFEQRFINEISISISIYEGEERTKALKEFLTRIQSDIEKTGLNAEQKSYFIQNIVNKINPSRFD